MEDVRSVGELCGARTAEEAERTERTAAQNLWRGDFKGAPEWFMRKYFTNEDGYACGRMRVAAYAKLGCELSKGGKPLLKRNGRPLTLTTGLLAQKVEEDCAEAGYPDVRVHFRGYSLEPSAFAMLGCEAQEEFEENESRHVPGLDEDECEQWNREAPLDREAWAWCAGNMLRALQMRQLMVLGLDEDFGKVMLAPDFVPASFNSELLALRKRMQETMSNEAALFLMSTGWDDFKEFERGDVLRTYRRCMRQMTGIEAGELMFEQAYLLGEEPAEGFDWKGLWEMMSKGYLTADPFADDPEASVYMEVLGNEADVDVIDWEYEPKGDENMFDDDSGELATGLLLRY